MSRRLDSDEREMISEIRDALDKGGYLSEGKITGSRYEWLRSHITSLVNRYVEPAPVPLILTCIACGGRHVDTGVWATRRHHTHACQHCGVTWRPAVEDTVGVQFLPGFKDEEEKS